MRNAGLKKRRWPDSRGVSFVEVIVSMMILSITVLALLGGFMLSLRLNMKSRSSMSATIVAQNVMECVKEYARAHVVQDGAMKSGVSEEEMKKLLPESYRDGFQVPGDGSIGFRLGGVREGMNEFDVVVSYDRSSYTDGSTGINDYKLPDLTALDSDRTVIVCPPGVTDGSLRRAAESAFYDSWLALQWALHADDEEEYDGPTSVEVSNERAYISANMTAELTIEMEQKLDGSYTGAAELNYCLGGSQHMSYRSEIAFDPPEPGEKPNLYLFYEPVQARALESGGFWIEDKIIVKNCFLEWNLFLAVQETAECLGGGTGGALRLAGPVLEQAPFSSGSKITVYSNSVPDWSAGGGGMFENGNSHDDKGFLFPRKSYDRLSEVTVTVYLRSSGEKLAEWNTSVSQ